MRLNCTVDVRHNITKGVVTFEYLGRTMTKSVNSINANYKGSDWYQFAEKIILENIVLIENELALLN